MLGHAIQTIGLEEKKYTLTKRGKTLTFEDWLEGLIHSERFRFEFNDLLCKVPFPAMFWETPSMTKRTINQKFEFVVLKSSALQRAKSMPKMFEDYFKKEEKVVHFTNLGGDAKLIVPCKLNSKSDYPHLKKFIKTAPAEQIDLLWKMVGEEYMDDLTDQPRWLSTAGLGVHWLHVRIDERPKYYHHRPYRDIF